MPLYVGILANSKTFATLISECQPYGSFAVLYLLELPFFARDTLQRESVNELNNATASANASLGIGTVSNSSSSSSSIVSVHDGNGNGHHHHHHHLQHHGKFSFAGVIREVSRNAHFTNALVDSYCDPEATLIVADSCIHLISVFMSFKRSGLALIHNWQQRLATATINILSTYELKDIPLGIVVYSIQCFGCCTYSAEMSKVKIFNNYLMFIKKDLATSMIMMVPCFFCMMQ